MPPECLPRAIKDRLASLYGTASSTISPITRSEIGSSCTITVEQVRIFVKFLSTLTTSDFTSKARIYFNNETTFYEVLREFGTEVTTCIPICHAVEKGTEEVAPFIILEDLEGYVPLKIGEGLSVELISVIVEELGRFHALSFAKRQFVASATSQLKETLFTPEHKSIVVSSIHDAYRLLKRSLPEGSIYVEVFSTFLLDVFNNFHDLVSEKNDYQVLTHGDLWPHNILWRSSDNSVKFIDFQASRFASPVHDLMLLLLTGLDKKNRNELIERYHRSLCNRLKEMGMDPVRVFPLSALQEQLKRQTKVAMGVAIVGLPLFYNEGQLSVTGGDESDMVARIFEAARSEMSFKCKSKMLEIIMDCIDLCWL